MKLHQIRDLFRQDPNPAIPTSAKKTSIPEKPLAGEVIERGEPCDAGYHAYTGPYGWSACSKCHYSRTEAGAFGIDARRPKPCERGAHRFRETRIGDAAVDKCLECQFTRGELMGMFMEGIKR